MNNATPMTTDEVAEMLRVPMDGCTPHTQHRMLATLALWLPVMREDLGRKASPIDDVHIAINNERTRVLRLFDDYVHRLKWSEDDAEHMSCLRSAIAGKEHGTRLCSICSRRPRTSGDVFCNHCRGYAVGAPSDAKPEPTKDQTPAEAIGNLSCSLTALMPHQSESVVNVVTDIADYVTARLAEHDRRGPTR